MLHAPTPNPGTLTLTQNEMTVVAGSAVRVGVHAKLIRIPEAG